MSSAAESLLSGEGIRRLTQVAADARVVAAEVLEVAEDSLPTLFVTELPYEQFVGPTLKDPSELWVEERETPFGWAQTAAWLSVDGVKRLRDEIIRDGWTKDEILATEVAVVQSMAGLATGHVQNPAEFQGLVRKIVHLWVERHHPEIEIVPREEE